MPALMILCVVGFAMATLGVALLVLGEVPFAGKRIPARRARLIGTILISFLPLVWAVQQGIYRWLGPDTVQGPVITWLLFAFCWICVGILLFRVMVPKHPSHPRTGLTPSPAAPGLFDPNVADDALLGKNAGSPAEKGSEVESWPSSEPAKKNPTKKVVTAKKPPLQPPGNPGFPTNDPFDFS